MLKKKYVSCMADESGKMGGSAHYDSFEEAMSNVGNTMTYFSGVRAATKMESKQNAIGIYDTFYDKNGIKCGKALWYEDPVASPAAVRVKYYDMVSHREYSLYVFEIYTQEKEQ